MFHAVSTFDSTRITLALALSATSARFCSPSGDARAEIAPGVMRMFAGCHSLEIARG
jgi:hypothetical protein